MGNKRKQTRRAARQALKSKPRIHGYEIDTIIVDELAAVPALPPKPKRDNSPLEARQLSSRSAKRGPGPLSHLPRYQNANVRHRRSWLRQNVPGRGRCSAAST